MAEILMKHYDAVSEYQKLKQRLMLTQEDIQALKQREYFYKKQDLFKRCRLCGQIKPLSEFYKHPLKRKKCFDECKECLKERKRNRNNEQFTRQNMQGQRFDDFRQ